MVHRARASRATTLRAQAVYIAASCGLCSCGRTMSWGEGREVSSARCHRLPGIAGSRSFDRVVRHVEDDVQILLAVAMPAMVKARKRRLPVVPRRLVAAARRARRCRACRGRGPAAPSKKRSAGEARVAAAQRDQLAHEAQHVALGSRSAVQSNQESSLSWHQALLLPPWLRSTSSPASSIGTPRESMQDRQAVPGLALPQRAAPRDRIVSPSTPQFQLALSLVPSRLSSPLASLCLAL